MQLRVSIAALLLSPVVLFAYTADQALIDFDPQKTQVAFVLSDTLHTVRGHFRLKEGHVGFDPARGTMMGDLVVDAASGDSGSGPRDKRMTRDILQAQQFPEIRFTPAFETGPISLDGASDVRVTGMFSIHGQSHKIVAPMHIQISGQDVTVTGKFDVPYVEWGMKNPSNFLIKVNQYVEIDVTAVGHIRGGNPSL